MQITLLKLLSDRCLQKDETVLIKFEGENAGYATVIKVDKSYFTIELYPDTEKIISLKLGEKRRERKMRDWESKYNWSHLKDN